MVSGGGQIYIVSQYLSSYQCLLSVCFPLLQAPKEQDVTKKCKRSKSKRDVDSQERLDTVYLIFNSTLIIIIY